MDVFDLIIIVVAVAYAIGGFRSGAIVGVFSLIGFFGGAVGGAQLADPIGSRVADGRAQVPVAILCVLLVAVLGQLIGVWIAGRIRYRFVRGKARPLDAGLGGVLGVVGVLVVAWMIAVPLAASPFPSLAAEAGHSRIVRAVDTVVPEPAREVYASMRDFLNQSGFPPVFGDLPSTSIVPVSPPPADLPGDFRRRIQAAQGSVLKIYGQAPQCERAIEGSGFVYARDRVLTNAHVVAGTESVQVEVPGGDSLRGRVVVYDPDRDVAVLSVPGLDAPVLPFAADDAKTNDLAAVLGYPEDGPFTVRSARVRGESMVRGNNIYGGGDVRRSIYSIRAIVQEGNSGGPLLDPDGAVLGMVFATALDSPDTGFVLTDDEIAPDARAGRTATAAVGTGSCTPD